MNAYFLVLRRFVVANPRMFAIRQRLSYYGLLFIDSRRSIPRFHSRIACPSAATATYIPPANLSDAPNTALNGDGRRVFFETYGCQMNVSDTEIAASILSSHGYNVVKTLNNADIVLLVTCAIREGAERKIWERLEQLKFRKWARARLPNKQPLRIGLLGCMAERLKSKILEKQECVDLIAGPDAYRDLPRLLLQTESGQNAVNVILSLEETYADITPVRISLDSVTAYVSVMRGCDNMCTYCIVPFTRGRERSRPIDSILDEVRQLSDQGVKEITLLGQNVNSYCDKSDSTNHALPSKQFTTDLPHGFKTVYKSKTGGRRFVDLLDKVSTINPEIRIRFTSPHPKDFPHEVLQLINERSNICKQLHMPAQSGNNQVLESMRRGYSREAYLDLIRHVKSVLPGVNITSDFIAGFCGETDKAHHDTIDLIRQVGYTFCYIYPYSMREKTKAHHHLTDDVPQDTKNQRVKELIEAFRTGAEKVNRSAIGSEQLVLIEGRSKRSEKHMAGRTDGGVKVIIENKHIPNLLEDGLLSPLTPGGYVVAKITEATSQTMKGEPICHSSIRLFESRKEFDTTDTAKIAIKA